MATGACSGRLIAPGPRSQLKLEAVPTGKAGMGGRSRSLRSLSCGALLQGQVNCHVADEPSDGV